MEGADGDPTVRSLEALLETLERSVADRNRLAHRVDELRKLRAEGATWQSLLRSETGDGVMQLMTDLLGGLSEASGNLRAPVVAELRKEGVSIPQIAKLLGVTHQRISSLLRRPPADGS